VLPPVVVSAIERVWKRTRWRPGSSGGTPAVSDCAGSADRDASAPPDAAPGVVSVATDPVGTNSDEMIRPDPAPEPIPIKKTEVRRRRKRRVPPEPPVPTFIMVSPGMYVRAEDPAPVSMAAAEGAVEDGTEPPGRMGEVSDSCHDPAAVPEDIPPLDEEEQAQGVATIEAASTDPTAPADT
jgi:hypothetical protein